MRIFLFLCAVVVVVLAGMFAWFYSLWDYEVLRYRLTYVVEVDGKERSGSSVVQVRYEDTTRLPLPGRGGGHEVTGEAVVLDLGDDRFLFSLLRRERPEKWKTAPNALPNTAFEKSASLHGSMVLRARQLNKEKPVAILAADQLPMLVRFRDINDPSTVKKVDPNNLSESFGPGVKLLRTTIEVTNDVVTEGPVGSTLVWLEMYREKGYRLNGSKCVACPISSDNLADLLGTGSFKLGDFQ